MKFLWLSEEETSDLLINIYIYSITGLVFLVVAVLMTYFFKVEW